MNYALAFLAVLALPLFAFSKNRLPKLTKQEKRRVAMWDMETLAQGHIDDLDAK